MDEGLRNEEIENLYLRYGGLVRRRCLLLLRDHALVDDTVQETFSKTMRSGAGIRGADHPLRWLYRVADRTCFDQLRKTKARRTSSIDDTSIDLPCHPDVEPEVRRSALELLDALDDEDQKIAVMAFVDGMNQQEIADELGSSPMTVLKRIARLRGRAIRHFQDRPKGATTGATKRGPAP